MLGELIYMEQWLIANQYLCRFGVFIVAFALFALWEKSSNWRQRLTSRRTRWLRHFSLAAISKLCIRLIIPIITISVAILMQSKGLGLLHQSHLPYLTQFMLGLLAFDLALYVQHRMLHKYRWLWRFHRVHHIDKELEVSTGLRFHPIEEMYTVGIKILAVGFFGILPLAVLLYEILYSLSLLFAHLNIRLHNNTEKALRRLIVTPGMHRIHHSDYSEETNSNYGFCLTWWDRLFKTYNEVSVSGERKLVFGLEEYRDPKYQSLINLLLLPLDLRYLRVKPIKRPKTKMKAY